MEHSWQLFFCFKYYDRLREFNNVLPWLMRVCCCLLVEIFAFFYFGRCVRGFVTTTVYFYRSKKCLKKIPFWCFLTFLHLNYQIILTYVRLQQSKPYLMLKFIMTKEVWNSKNSCFHMANQGLLDLWNLLLLSLSLSLSLSLIWSRCGVKLTILFKLN